MAGEPLKRLFWQRVQDALEIAGVVRDGLAAVASDLASPLHGRGDDDDDDDHGLLLIEECEKMLAQTPTLLALAMSSLGTVDLLALRCMRSDDAAEVRVARDWVSEAYDAVTSSRGHLGAARRLLAAPGIPKDAVDDERVAVLAALAAATRLLDALDKSLAYSSAPAPALLHADSRTLLAAAPPILVGAKTATSSDATWSEEDSVPASLLRVALSGAVPEIEAAQAAIRVAADAVEKGSSSKVAADEWCRCYNAAFRALDAAHAALSRLLALNTEASIFLVRCAPQHNLDRGGKGWRSSDSWEASRTDVERQGRAALDGLCSASAYLDLWFAGVLGPLSSSTHTQEARELLDRALAEADKARDAGVHLRHAAAREFFHAWAALHGAPST